MKNLITKYVEGAPLKSAKDTHYEEVKHDWDYKHKSESHPTDGITPWKRIKRICESYIGKPFDKAFSEYCSQVPAYQQKFFMEEFERTSRKTDYWTYYYVDKQGNIQKHIGTYFLKKKKVFYYSDDYKTEKRHKITGAAYPQYHWIDKKFKEEDYETAIVQGFAIEFKSVKDPEYIRLTTDQKKRKKAAARELAKEKAVKTYSFISKLEKELEREKARNKVKIEAKGFDYETSFRKEGEINPDVIKDKQGFTK
jgi:hypothetical protein